LVWCGVGFKRGRQPKKKKSVLFWRKREGAIKKRGGGGGQFSRLLAAEVCASVVVMLDTPCSEVEWRVLATHSIRQFPLHFPSRASPCAITLQLESTTAELPCLTPERYRNARRGRTQSCLATWYRIQSAWRSLCPTLLRLQLTAIPHPGGFRGSLPTGALFDFMSISHLRQIN